MKEKIGERKRKNRERENWKKKWGIEKIGNVEREDTRERRNKRRERGKNRGKKMGRKPRKYKGLKGENEGY